MTPVPRHLNLALLIGRVPLGLYFLIAGWNKIAGIGLEAFVRSTVKNVPPWAGSFGSAYLYALPFVEMLAGLLVVVGLLVRLNAMLMAMMLVSFLIAQAGPVFIARVHGETPGIPFDRNVLLLSFALVLALLGGGAFGIDGMTGRRRSRRMQVLEVTRTPTTSGRVI